MRPALPLLLLTCVILVLPTTAMAAPVYPECPPTVEDRTLTSTSHRGDEAYPQIVCWYEDKQPVYEFHASWASDSYKGSAGIGCGKPNDAPDTKIISYTHEAFVGTNWAYEDMPGFEKEIHGFLLDLETNFAKACGAEDLGVNATGPKAAKPAKGSREYCETNRTKLTCKVLEKAQLKVCNVTASARKFASKSKANRFRKKLAPGKCFTREIKNPTDGDYRIRIDSTDAAGVAVLFVLIKVIHNYGFPD